MTAYTELDNMERLARLEAAVTRLIAVNNEQEKVNEKLHKKNKRMKKMCGKMITKGLNDALGRDEEIGRTFTTMVERYEERFREVSDRVGDLAEVIEDMIP